MAQLTLDQLSKHFGSVVAVDQISINVNDGEFLCILGPSGCGKSTALRMIAGFELPTSGDIRIDDKSITSLQPNKRPTAMVFQKYTLWPHMSVFNNIAFGLKLRGIARKDIQKKVEDGLALVGLAGYEDRYPSQLSGGQQQRVALARALVLEPKILLLDEPFSSLDALLRVRLREELKRIQRRLQITTIFVTHDQEEALSLADRIAVMSEGHIEQVSEPGEMYARPQSLFVADFIGDMNLLQAEVEADTLRVGRATLSKPEGLAEAQTVTVAVRPEELTVLSEGQSAEVVWEMQVEQSMDLGHYRKVLGEVAGVGLLKVYLPKSVVVAEGVSLRVSPARYLVYLDEQAPIEVTASSQPAAAAASN